MLRRSNPSLLECPFLGGYLQLKIPFAFCSPRDIMTLEMAEPGTGTQC
jgi:hypothetical protein